MISATYADGRGDGRKDGIARGTIGRIRRRSGVGKDGGGGHRRQAFTKMAGHVLTKVRGTTGDGQGWVRTAETE